MHAPATTNLTAGSARDAGASLPPRDAPPLPAFDALVQPRPQAAAFPALAKHPPDDTTLPPAADDVSAGEAQHADEQSPGHAEQIAAHSLAVVGSLIAPAVTEQPGQPLAGDQATTPPEAAAADTAARLPTLFSRQPRRAAGEPVPVPAQAMGNAAAEDPAASDSTAAFALAAPRAGGRSAANSQPVRENPRTGADAPPLPSASAHESLPSAGERPSSASTTAQPSPAAMDPAAGPPLAAAATAAFSNRSLASPEGQGAAPTASHPASAGIEAPRLLARVARAFAAAQERDGEVRLRLSPPELGSLRLRVQVQDGALVARLEAETSAARTALIDNLPALRERLAEQGVRIERFDVDLMQRHGGGTPDRPGGQQRDVEPLVRPAPLPRPSSASAAIATDHSVVPPAGSGRLNVVV